MTFARDLANFADTSANNQTFRNIIINGGFSIDQRNSGSSQTFTAAAALTYSVDRWYGYCTGANITGARVAGTAPSQFFYRFTGATSNTAVGFGQRIEAANSFHFANRTAVLSVNLASTSITSVTWTAFYANTTDTFGTLASPTRTQIATSTFTINSTLSRYSAVINVPSAATTGIEIVFTTGALVGSQTLTFDDAQFELGSSPSAFEQRPVGTELALCQRYYYKLTCDTAGSYAQISGGYVLAGTSCETQINMPVSMRTRPTTFTSSAVGTFYISAATGAGAATVGPTIQRGTNETFQFIVTRSGLTSGHGIQILQNGADAAFITASAEL
jgi:hypothetical protein